MLILELLDLYSTWVHRAFSANVSRPLRVPAWPALSKRLSPMSTWRTGWAMNRLVRSARWRLAWAQALWPKDRDYNARAVGTCIKSSTGTWADCRNLWPRWNLKSKRNFSRPQVRSCWPPPRMAGGHLFERTLWHRWAASGRSRWPTLWRRSFCRCPFGKKMASTSRISKLVVKAETMMSFCLQLMYFDCLSGVPAY